jgi:hypothetical protein
MIQNVRLKDGNFARVDGYFYSFDEQTDTMVQKTDDGTLAFAYPLDTPIPRQVIDLTYDGESWWTMEHISGTPSAGFVIKRWIIANFVMVLQQTLSFATDSNDTFESDAFAVERYEATITANGGINNDELTVSFPLDVFRQITSGTTLFLGPSTHPDYLGEFLRVTASSTNENTFTITLTSDKNTGFLSGDKVVFSKQIWLFNQNYLQETGTGALYKVSLSNGSILSRTKGGAFKDIDAADFVDLTDVFSGDLDVFNLPSYLIFIRTNNLLFINVLDSQLITSLSSIQNNLSPETTEVYTVFDLAIEGDTFFRLQQKFNINGDESTSTTFNYQLATFKPFPTAIALSAEPAIIPADSNSTSLVTAVVTDQYALPYLQPVPAQIFFETSGGGSNSSLTSPGPKSLDGNGQATTTYNAGQTAGLVTISAEVTI